MHDLRIIAVFAVFAVVAGCGSVPRPASPASDRAAATTAPSHDADASVVYVDVDDTLLAAAPDGAGGWFIGGRFTHVAGQPRAGLAHLGADGELDPGWTPSATGRVRFPNDTHGVAPEVSALCVVGDTVYVGGVFASINGRPRSNLAAVNARTGRVRGWNPRPNGRVDALAAGARTLYGGGLFTRIARKSRERLAAFDTRTGALTAWNPAVTGRVREATEPDVTVLVLDNDRLYVGGRFTVINGRERYGLAALDVATGAPTKWKPFGGEVMALALAGDTVYVGGFFGEVEGGVVRESLAAFDARTGRVLPWRADAVSRPDDPGFVDAVALVGDRLYVGGDFAELAGEPRKNLGVVSAITGAAIPWQLRPSAGDYSLVAADDHVLVGSDFTSDNG
jgi:hypothetical protein